ncbi:MAG: CysB family HTH-type transcriptional regulator [Gammaproteobacteria bacterium]|nr:CysB family HTH-type transcriptional regulator [Gammaproteobacteria bacterium]
MKLKQLQYISTVAKCDFNISQAADKLHTTQPGVSTQIRLLEEELGSLIFVRHGKRIIELTPAGHEVLRLAEEALLKVDAIREVSEDLKHEDRGTLTIATTHTQARYALPSTIAAFVKEFPKVQLRIRQSNPTEIANMVVRGEADIGIATESLGEHDELLVLPVYRWNRCVVAPLNHPILAEKNLTLQKISEYPIVTYDFAFAGRTAMNKAFSIRRLKPNVVLSAVDGDVIKHYVELGLGIGILGNMAYDPRTDTGLRSVDVSDLFDDSISKLGVRKGRYLRQYVYRFMELFGPHLVRRVIEPAIMGGKLEENTFDLDKLPTLTKPNTPLSQ